MWQLVLADHIGKRHRYKEFVIEKYQPFWGSHQWKIRDKEGKIIIDGIVFLKKAKDIIDNKNWLMVNKNESN
jgi:hypothetical protein